ncbi:hypothetical protein ACVIGB_000078 [Bradyrhizobium sp. USDA 4341]
MKQFTRRSFLTVAAAFPTARAFAAPGGELYLPSSSAERSDLFLPGSAAPGLPASPYLIADIDQLHGIVEGSGDCRIRIVFEFSCPRSPELYRRIRPMLTKAKYDWMPVPPLVRAAGQSGPGAVPSDAPAAALFARDAGAETLEEVFAGRPAKSTDIKAATRQAILFKRKIGPELYVETNRPFVTPTLIYRGRDGETRIIRGSPDLGTLRTIVASAQP